MTIFTRDFNRNSSYWTAILFYLICGLLLLLMPNLALSIANVALAILLCAWVCAPSCPIFAAAFWTA